MARGRPVTDQARGRPVTDQARGRPVTDQAPGPRADVRCVAYVLSEFPSLTETFVTTECTLLEARGFEVLPFSLRRPARPCLLPGADEWRRRTGYARLASPWSLGGAGARRAIAIVTDHLRLSPTEGAWAARALPAAAWIAERARDVDHVHTHFERGAAILASLVAALLDRPWSFTAHAFGVYLSAPRALAYRCRNAAFVRVSHQAIAARLRALVGASPPLRAVLARTPLPPDFFGVAPSESPRVQPAKLLVIARDVPKKGLDLLPAISDQLRAMGHAHLIEVIGPSSRRIPPWTTSVIRHLGPLPHAEIRRRLMAATLSLLPCRVAPNGDRDGLPLSLIESMALGLPAVSTRVGGIAEAYPGELANLLAAPEDTVGIARAVAALLASPDYARHVSALGIELVGREYGPSALEPLAAALSGEVAATP